MIATALSRLPNDRTNERTAATIACVSVGAVVFALCIMYSCLCSSSLLHYLCEFSSGPCLASSHLSPLSFPFSLLLSFMQQGDASNERQALPKEHDDHHQLYSSSLSLSIAWAAFHLWYSSLQLFLLPLAPFSSPSFSLSVCHSLPHLLIPNSTFHQLLVSPNSCHVDVDGLGTFRLTPCKCGSLKWRVG